MINTHRYILNKIYEFTKIELAALNSYNEFDRHLQFALEGHQLTDKGIHFGRPKLSSVLPKVMPQ